MKALAQGRQILVHTSLAFSVLAAGALSNFKPVQATVVLPRPAITTATTALIPQTRAIVPAEMHNKTVMSAGMLRATLATLLGEHVLLAARATDAALHSRDDEFKAAAAALDHNSEAIAWAIGLVYGQEASDAFLPLWREHIGFFVDYTTAVATQDEAARTQAVNDLTAYAADFGAFLAAANPNLTVEAVQTLLGPHVGTLTAVIDAQAVDDYPTAYTQLRDAYQHMDMIAVGLTGAIAQQFPASFPGAADAPAAGLRTAVNQLLAEHVALAASATDAALHGREEEFTAAADALDGNSVDLSAAIAAVYGEEAGDAFLPLWRKHIGFFVDYTTAVAQQDEAAQTQAVNDLTAYAADFGAFLAAANPNLTIEAVQTLLGPHVGTLTAVIDAQAADDMDMAYRHWREAYAHMSMIANPLSDAIIAQFPETFGTEEQAPPAAESPLPDEQADVVMAAPMLRATLDLLLGEHVALAASATDAALRGREEEFKAAAKALDGNSVDIAGAIGLVYGQEAEEAFLPLWRKHIGFFVDYTTAVAQQDKKAQQQALAALDAYAEDFGAFIAAANPNLTKAAVADLLRQHVTTLTAVIDAQAMKTVQASGNQMKAYPALRTAFAHMDMEALALAQGIAKQFPNRFPGMADTAAAELRTALTQLLTEHALLLIKTADAATQARNIEYEAAFAALDENSVALAKAIGAVYGEEAGDAFLPLWRKHIGFFIDYTLAVIDENDMAKTKAVTELTDYAQDFAAFLNAANPDLPVDVVAALVGEHAMSTLAAIDATVAEDPAAYYTALRAAYAHMSMIAGPLSDAIIAQFPETFGTEEQEIMAAQSAMAHSMAITDTMTMSDTMPMHHTMAMTDTMTMTETIPLSATLNESMTYPVAISTFTFKPRRLEVPLGATVVWTNNDAITHTVTSGVPGTPDGIFDSGNFGQGETFAVTFEEAGEYPYFCNRHNGMRGVVVVIK